MTGQPRPTVGKPRLIAPPDACDAHVHMYGPRERYALAPTAAYPPPLARVSDYRALAARLGTSRVVLVQPSAYGFDNTCQLDGVAELGSCARAIVVVRPDTTDAELARLHAAGARGARFMMLKGAVMTWEMLEPVASRIAPLGWHVQLQFDGRLLPEREAQIRALPCPVVIDHNGKFLEPPPVDSPGVRALLRLLDSGRVWVKASAPYETSRRGPPRYEDVGAIARALIAHAPERMLWASNWPHGGVPEPLPDDANLLDLLLDWAPDDAVRRRMLVDNPAALYGFGT